MILPNPWKTNLTSHFPHVKQIGWTDTPIHCIVLLPEVVSWMLHKNSPVPPPKGTGKTGGVCLNIGSKLKKARIKAGMTQEHVAEQIGVTRQTMSNWENSKCYPDIRSVVALSELYEISLDELLKEDSQLMEYLEESTDVVKSRQKLSRLILILAYVAIWALVIMTFWLGGRSDAMGFSLVNFYLILPASTIIISIFIGSSDGWSNCKWLMLLFFGLMNMLAPYATFSLANMISLQFSLLRWPDLSGMLPGILCGALGMGIGSLMKTAAKKRRKKTPPYAAE